MILDQLLLFASTPTSILSLNKSARASLHLNYTTWSLNPSLSAWHFNYFCKYYLF
jgi:hypothetical protein